MKIDPAVQKPWVHLPLILANPSWTPPGTLQNNHLLLCLDISSQKSRVQVGKNSFSSLGAALLQISEMIHPKRHKCCIWKDRSIPGGASPEKGQQDG